MNRFLELTKAVAITAAMAAPIAAFAADDYSNNLDSTAFAVQVGEIYSGNIEVAGDVDVFRITTTKQAVITPYTVGASARMLVNMFNSSGGSIGGSVYTFTNNAALGNTNVVHFTENAKWTPDRTLTSSLPPGTYYFTVKNLTNSSSSYKFGVDYWDTSSIATPSTYHIATNDFLGNSIWHAWENAQNLSKIYSGAYGGEYGILEQYPNRPAHTGAAAFEFGGDIDYQIINVTTAGLLTGSSSYYSGQNTDTWGYLRDVNGNILSQNDDTGGLNFQVSARVNPGIYYLEIRHYNRMGGTGSYNWTVSMTP